MKTRIAILTLLFGAFAAGAAGSDDVMRLTPVGYRLDAAGDVTPYDPSVVTVAPSDTSIVYSNSQVTLTADLNRDYKVIRWQKFDVDPRGRTTANPIEEFGEKRETVSVDFNPNVTWMYVTVVVEYDPVRTVKASLSSFARGTVTVSPEKTSYQKGDVVTLTAEPAEGYSFVRWSDGNADHVRTLTVSNDVDLTASIEPDSSSVSFSAGVGAVMGVTSKRVTFGNAYGELPVPTRTGVKFSGWVDDEKRAVTAKTEVNRTADHTLYASWSDLLYEIAWDSTGRGKANGRVEGAGIYAYGSQPTLTAVPYEGSTFVGWTDGETCKQRRITVLSNALYVAAFDVASYDVTFTYRDASGKLVTTAPTTVEHEGKVDPPSKDVVDSWSEHTFRTWSTEEYKKVTRDLAVEAIYDTMTYSVAFAYRDWQGNSVTTMPQHVTAGGKANPPDRSVVDNWAGNTFRGWAPDYNVIRQDTLCEAIYEINSYEVKFTYHGVDGELREQVETVQHGDMVQAVPETAVVDRWPGHRFLGWSNEDYLRPITGKLEVIARYEGYCEIDYRDALGTNLVEEVKDPKDWTNLRPVADLKEVEGYAFEKTGYKFSGWKTNETGNAVYEDGARVRIQNGDVLALISKWDPITYTLVFNGNGGKCNVPNETMTYDDHDFRKVIVVDESGGPDTRHTVRDGYELIGWSQKKKPSAADEVLAIATNAAGAITVAVTNNLTVVDGTNMTLYAIWKGKPQTVTIDDGHGGKKVDQRECGTEIDDLGVPADWTGHQFAGWLTNDVAVEEFPIDVPVNGITLRAGWTTNTYTVAFHGTDADGGAMEPQAFTYDVAQALTSNGFTRTGYTFANWTNEVGTVFADGAQVKNLATNDGAVVDLYATWTMNPRYYAVRFNPNGGAGAPYVQDIECGVETALTPNRFARTGYGFAGWDVTAPRSEGAAGTVVYTNGEKVTDLAAEGETNDLYAVWTANRFWVRFDGNSADGGEAMPPQAFTYDVAQALTSNAFTRTGYGFAGWVTNLTGSAVFADGATVSNLTAEPNATNTLWATWAPNKYTVLIDGVPTEMDYGSDIAKPADPAARDGYAFTGWTTNGAAVAAWPLKVPLGGLTISSAWEANAYTVEFRGPGEAYTQGFTYDVSQALTANRFTPPELMVFDCWTNAVDSTTYADCETVCNVATGGVFALYATWKDAPSYAVAFDGNGADGGSMATNRFECGKGGTLPANDFTRTGSAFDQWTNKVNGATYADSATFAEDLAPTNGTAILSALWTPNRYWVKFDGNGADGGEAMAVQAFTYDVAQALTANIFTKTGYGFAGWATNETGSAVFADGAVVSNLTAEPNATNTLWATWTPNKYTVVIDGVPTEMDYGSDIEKPADPAARKGYTFTDWTTNGVPVAAWPLKVPLGGLTISSAWTANAYTVEFRGPGEAYTQDFTYDEPQALEANSFPAPEMMVFDCWTNAVDSTTYADCETVSNLTTDGVFALYATWKDAPSYAVAFDGNGADGGSMATNRFECGKGGKLGPNKFSRTGYAFDQWTNKVNGATYADSATFAEDLAPTNGTATLSALWTPNRYWVKFDGNGGAGEMPQQEFTYDVAQALTSNAFTRTGYGFAGWATNETGSAVFADGATVSNLTAEPNATNTLWATWAVKSYEISFDSMGGSAVGPVTNDYGKAVSEPTPTKKGYQFDGWYEGEVKFDFSSMPARNVMLTAHWTANAYTVEFRGPGEAYTQNFTYDEPQALEANRFPAPEMMVFDCWTNAVDSTTYADCETVSNLTTDGVFALYATWKDAPSYAVAFDGNGADGGSMATNRFECGKGGKLGPNKFSRTGYAFDQWTNKVNGATYTDGATFAEDLAPTNGTATLSALWKPNRYWVRFDGNDADGGEAMAVQEFTYDVAQALTSNAFTRTGYGFAGWDVTAPATRGASGTVEYADGAVVSNLTAEADVTNTLWAVWTANQYMVVYHGPDGATSDQPFTYDKAQKLKGADTFDPPEKWMVFAGWTNAVGETYAADLTVSNLTAEADGMVNLYAVWGDDSYTVTFDGNCETGGTMEPQIFKHGETKTLEPNEFKRIGHTFVKWTDDDGKAYFDKAMFKVPETGIGETLHAVWSKNKYTDSFVDDGKSMTDEFDYGARVTRDPPSSKPGYTFNGWTTNGIDVIDLDPATSAFVQPDHDIVFTSKREPITYTIAFDGNGATSGAMAATNVKYDVEIALPSNAYEWAGHEFLHWTNSVGEVKDDGEPVKNLTTEAGKTVTLYAVWKESGDPLCMALTLPSDWTAANPGKAWTVIGVPVDGKGLQRTSADESAYLEINVPGPGSLYFEFDFGKSMYSELDVDFNGERIYDDSGDPAEYQSSDTPTLQIETAGTLRFSGAPDNGATWTLRNFRWTAK